MDFNHLVPYLVRAGLMVLAGILNTAGLIGPTETTALQAIAVAVPSKRD